MHTDCECIVNYLLLELLTLAKCTFCCIVYFLYYMYADLIIVGLVQYCALHVE